MQACSHTDVLRRRRSDGGYLQVGGRELVAGVDEVEDGRERLPHAHVAGQQRAPRVLPAAEVRTVRLDKHARGGKAN